MQPQHKVKGWWETKLRILLSELKHKASDHARESEVYHLKVNGPEWKMRVGHIFADSALSSQFILVCSQ